MTPLENFLNDRPRAINDDLYSWALGADILLSVMHEALQDIVTHADPYGLRAKKALMSVDNLING